MRGGVRVTKRQAEIYDQIKRRGEHGIKAREMGNVSSVKTQIYIMRENGIPIASTGGRHDGGYYLRRST
jgi:hypothetical protein